MVPRNGGQKPIVALTIESLCVGSMKRKSNNMKIHQAAKIRRWARNGLANLVGPGAGPCHKVKVPSKSYLVEMKLAEWHNSCTEQQPTATTANVAHITANSF